MQPVKHLAKHFEQTDDSWRKHTSREVEYTLPSGVVAKYYVPPWEDAWITLFGQYGSVRKCCAMIGIDRKTVYSHRQYSPAFAERWDLALQESYDRIWEASFERGVEGVVKPVFYQGEVVGEVVEYSDRLLETLLKGTRPQMFRNAPEPQASLFDKPQIFLPEVVDENAALPSPQNNDPDETHMIDAQLKPSQNETLE